MENKFRIYDKYNNHYVEEPYHRFLLANNGMLYNNEIDKWYQPHERYEIEWWLGFVDKEGTDVYEADLLDFDQQEWGSKFEPEAVYLDDIVGSWGLCGSFSDVPSWRKVVGNVHSWVAAKTNKMNKTETVELKVRVRINYEEGYKEEALTHIRDVLIDDYAQGIGYDVEVVNVL